MNKFKRYFRTTLAQFLNLAQLVIPTSDSVTVYGAPTTEGNAVEMIRGLAARYSGRIYVLCDKPEDYFIRPSLVNVTFVRRHSIKGYWHYLRSEVAFFTHGYYGRVRTKSGKLLVNLWHGEGIKINGAARATLKPVLPANFVVGSTVRCTEEKTIDFKLPAEAALVTGNPRTAQFYDEISISQRHAIGLDDRKYIVWMPTFRSSTFTHDGYSSSKFGLREQAERVLHACLEHDFQLVIKAHRQDAEVRDIDGAISLTDELLSSNGISLYSVLGSSAGLISDYSSVWIDYLLLSRPIGFLIPDIDQYVSSRGLLFGDLREWMPGLDISDPANLQRFIEEASGLKGSFNSQELRERAAHMLGLNWTPTPGDDLITRLATLGAFTHGSICDPTARRSISVFQRGAHG